MSTDPSHGNFAMQTGQPSGAEPPAGTPGGTCSSCGRPLLPPDLEAIASGIDQTLSMETGNVVGRASWAGHPPDGVMDGLFGFLPNIKAKRKLWERGQALWTERMTAALSGPCPECLGQGAQPVAPLAGDASATMALPANPPPAWSPPQPVPGAGDQTLGTQILAPPQQHPEPEAATMAFESEGTTAMVERPEPLSAPPASPPPAGPVEDTERFGAVAPRTETEKMHAVSRTSAPEPPGDEHEAHTVMLSGPLNLRAGGPRLVVLEGPVHGRQFSLGRPTTTIGRSIGCHVTVEADSVAYDHARVVKAGDAWQIEPVGDADGAFVNDDPLTGSRRLQNGDIIRIGPARFRFEMAS